MPFEPRTVIVDRGIDQAAGARDRIPFESDRTLEAGDRVGSPSQAIHSPISQAIDSPISDVIDSPILEEFDRPGVSARRVEVRSSAAGRGVDRPDWVVVEEPLETRAQGPGQDPISVAVTMRTPGHDAELAVGFLHTEGLLAGRDELTAVPEPRSGRSKKLCNVITIKLNRRFDPDSLRRNFFATSSCGLCGKATLDQLLVRCPPIPAGPEVDREIIIRLPEALREAQRVFDRTGGLHAAGLFDLKGRLIALREDVGRHNAVDKIVGRGLLDGATPLSRHILLVSGRIGFEIVQKAAVAGIPILCAVSAPTSLSVETANKVGMTLVGFLRGDSFNVYTHYDRIIGLSQEVVI
jgi:FdhD protein